MFWHQLCTSCRLQQTHIHMNEWMRRWLAKEPKLDQRPCVGKGYLIENSCPSLSLPLTLAWQQLEIWGLSRPLSWEKDTGRHTYALKSFCFISLPHSPSLTQTYKEERKAFVFARSLTQLQIEIFVSYKHTLPSSQTHSIITLHFLLLSVC